MARGRKNSNRLGMLGISIVVVAFCAVIAIRTDGLKEKNNQLEVQEQELQEQLAKEQERSLELEEKKVYVQTKQYVEEMAKTVNSSISETAYQFLMELFMKFEKYSRKEGTDPQKDRLSLRTCFFTLTDDSFDSFMQEIGTVMEKYQKAEENGKLRSISFISAPIEEEGK